MDIMGAKPMSIEVGSRYGRLTTTGPVEYQSQASGRRRAFVPVRCDCGTIKLVRTDGMKSGHIVACGCYMREAVAAAATKVIVLPDGRRVCTRCGQAKESDQFPLNDRFGSGLDSQCKACYAGKQQKRRDEGLDKEVRRRRDLWKKYGITLEDWENMYARQQGQCPVCLTDLTKVKKICVDHHHASGAVRGLLCSECNVGIGFLGDSADTCARAAEHLSATRAQEKR